jgi:hypothetical protein
VTLTTVQITPYILAQGEEIACYPALGIAVVRDGARTYSGALLAPRPATLGAVFADLDRLGDDLDELGPLTVDEDFSDEAAA